MQVQRRLHATMQANKSGYFKQFLNVDLHRHQPLDIKETVGEKEASGYKSPWNQQAAKYALTNTGMYEAGASLVWLKVLALSEEELLLAGGMPSWANVLEAEEQRFKPSRCINARPDLLGDRLLFPLNPLAVYAELDTFNAGNFDGNLKLLSGHCYVYAWYLAMFRALDAENEQQVAVLWQASLTATFHCRHGLTLPELLLWSVQISESRKQEDAQ